MLETKKSSAPTNDIKFGEHIYQKCQCGKKMLRTQTMWPFLSFCHVIVEGNVGAIENK